MLLLLACLVCGCLESDINDQDEEREPQFLEGKARLRDLDYKGAIDSFQKTLEINPRHAEANFQLGWLYDQKEADPAAAIYHYNRYLRLRPNSDKQDTVKSRMLACKQELARTVSLGPVTQTLQREFENLSEENKRLREELDKWRTYAGQMQAWSNQLAAQALAWQAHARTQAARPPPVNPPAQKSLVRSAETPRPPPGAVASRNPALPKPVMSSPRCRRAVPRPPPRRSCVITPSVPAKRSPRSRADTKSASTLCYPPIRA